MNKISKFWKEINQELNIPLVFTHTFHLSQMGHLKPTFTHPKLLASTPLATHKLWPTI